MPSILNEKFKASCIGAALGESIAMPTENMSPEQIQEHFGKIKGPAPRPESQDFYPLPSGSTARQSEAMLAVLKASKPLPDLQGFAINIKDAFNRFPMLWPKHATFPWPPFPDEGHYTFSFAMPAAFLLVSHKKKVDELAEWMKSLAPVSVVWQQGTWIYLRLLAWLYEKDPESFERNDFLKIAMKFADEAENHFPNDYKMKRRMQLTEPLLNGSLDEVAKACGNIDIAAENILAFVGAVFYQNHHNFRDALISSANIGGCSGAVGFYLGSLIGALHGHQILPGEWLDKLRVKESVESAVFNYIH